MSIVLCRFCAAEVKFRIEKKISIHIPAASRVSLYENCNKVGQITLDPLGAELVDTQYYVYGKCSKCGMALPSSLAAHWDSTRKIIIMERGLDHLFRSASKEEHKAITNKIQNRSKSKQLIGLHTKTKAVYKGILKAASTKRAAEQHYDN